MGLPLFQIDAFAERPFAGNPAAVVPLETWPDAALMQQIAAENNLSETAFVAPEGEGYRIRWFTPTVEVDLCGHATLAAARVLFEGRGGDGDEIRFASRSGALRVTRDGAWLTLDFPARPAAPCDAPTALAEGLNAAPRRTLAADDYVAVFDDEARIRALTPDFARLRALDLRGVIATAPGKGCDFVSRFFAPNCGIDEDPVTGSAHCTLAPYWSARLGRSRLTARQLSARGGEIRCEVRGARVLLSGQTACYMRGEILAGT